MTQIKNYSLSMTEVADIAIDGNYLWIAYEQDSDGNCTLQKVSAFDPSLIYFDIDIVTSAINKIKVSGSYIYLAMDDASYIGARYNTFNPIATYTNMSLPVGITEAPIDTLVIGSYVYFLTPGLLSGETAKIYVYSTTGTYNQTIDLATVTNAKSFTTDGTEIWLVTYQSPLHLVRVYNLSTTPTYTVI